ncbi:TPA: hypothetical protein QCS32_003888 [Bacillus thuringiensis]|uniref:Uncharacterized protein n=1 Tax=Bacillus thuringiensis serovar iberica TaxID=180866 RepID=A0A9X6LPY4_BACTU|nr:hypothetical protein [Bacillus thuringiensis]MEB8992061.1 hypothetical protein [Bacillus cereus]MEB9180103.1 hypothetical protein [Bacillus cereus]MEB9625058.1 hypothetical protein [Bacillus cereus]OUB46587.1 hypothetical protein BK741_18305 [Bacillus thuringiensis serovar iberica]HDR5352190.1 hypothetical protein [Bacillus thuringiensis]
MSELKEIITTQKAIEQLERGLRHRRNMLNYLNDDDESAELIKREIGSIAAFLNKQGVEIKKESPEILVLRFIEVGSDYVAKELREETTKNFFYLESGTLKPLANYKVFEKEIIDNPDKVRCYEQLKELEDEI